MGMFRPVSTAARSQDNVHLFPFLRSSITRDTPPSLRVSGNGRRVFCRSIRRRGRSGNRSPSGLAAIAPRRVAIISCSIASEERRNSFILVNGIGH